MNLSTNPLTPGWTSLMLAASLAVLPTGCVIIGQSEQPARGPDSVALEVDFKDPVLNSRKILLTTALNERSTKEIVLKLQYLESQGTSPIDLYLNTDGGPVQFAFGVIDVMRSLKSPVNTWAMGNCNSGGAMILASGTGRRRAFPNVVIAIHGGKRLGRVPPGYIRIVDPQIDGLWKQRARLPESWYPLKGDTLHFLTAKQAVDYGVIDEVAEGR